MSGKSLKTIGALLLLLTVLLCARATCAEEAEDLTAGCKIKLSSSQHGKDHSVTDGNYETYWESKKTKNPFVAIQSEKPIYGLYLCFQIKPESYEIQDGAGKKLADGETLYHHVFYALNGEKEIRIQATDEKKTSMGFNEIFVFGEGEIPDWVQRWEPAAEKADLLFISAHPDDELLFMGGAIATYAVGRDDCSVVIAYLTSSNTTRRSELLNGLWAMGIRRYPDIGGFRDFYYNKSSKMSDIYKAQTGGKDGVLSWMTELYRKYKPEVVVTHDVKGEYGHPQHKLVADAAQVCYDLSPDGTKYTESAGVYGTWQVKKLYLHLYGEEENQTKFNWDLPIEAAGGKTGNELAEIGYAQHKTQAGKGQTIHGKREIFSVKRYGGELYPSTCFGLCRSEVGEDEAHNDFFEHITLAEKEPKEPAEEMTEVELPAPEEPAETEEPDEQTPGEENKTDGEDAAAEPAGTGETTAGKGPAVPEWADVQLNERGFLDEGEYILEDEENGHWMYVGQTLRIQIVRTWETFERPSKKSTSDQNFYCFTTDIWCDIENGELPLCIWQDPETRGKTKKPATVPKLAQEHGLIFAVSADYFPYRASQKRTNKNYHVGIEIRDGEILWDDPEPKPPAMPTYETLALFPDGHAESYKSTERDAQAYLDDGAIHVYTFGPCLVKDGEITQQMIDSTNIAYNPRHAFGVVEPGHYVDVICEGRMKKKNGSTGVTMMTLATIMYQRGCTLAVNLDGGDTAACAFLGKKLNWIADRNTLELIDGRAQTEVIAFGIRNVE